MIRFLIRSLECLFVWGQPKPEGDPSQVQIILTQAMCDLVDGNTSKINRDMADFVERYHRKFGLPVFPQGDLSKALKQKGVRLFAETRSCSASSVVGKNYFGSYEVALEQKELCEKMGWKRIILVSFVPHIWRAKWLYERLGFEVIIPAEIPRMVFQRGLVQWRWRRAVTAFPYEFLARLYYLCKRYI